MIDWVALILLMKEVAISIALIISFFGWGVILFRWRHELSSKCYLPWEKEERKARRRAERERKKKMRREAKRWA